MFFKQPPTRTFVKKSGSKNKPGSKVLKERVTLLFGANASGCYRLKPLLIGKSKNPRAFKKAKGPLPVIYRANKKAKSL